MHALAETDESHRVCFGKALFDLVDVTNEPRHGRRFEVCSDLLRMESVGRMAAVVDLHECESAWDGSSARSRAMLE